MKTYRNTSAEWGDFIGGLTIEDYEAQATIFNGEVAFGTVVITADNAHIYADGVPVADAE